MRKKALLIGNDNYPNITHLKFAANDAECVADSLCRNYGFTDDEIVLMTSRKQGDFYPYLRNMMNKLTELCTTSGSLDLLTLGFWGHGFRIADGTRYLCGPETNTNDLRNTALSFDYVMGCVGQIGAAVTILLLDCCQNVPSTMGAADSNTFSSVEADALGAAVRQSTRDVFARRQEMGYEAQAPTVAILNSCSAGQRAYVWDEKGHGVFTHFLLEAMDLRKATADDCFEYVSQKMNCGNFWAGQRPCFKSEGSRARLLDDTEVVRTPIGHVDGPIGTPEKKWRVGKVGAKQSVLMAESALIAKIKSGEIGWDYMISRPGIDWVSVFDVFPQLFEDAAPPERTQERVRYSFADRTAGDSWGEQSSSPAAGTLKTVNLNGVEYRFRWCPAGSFMMGSDGFWVDAGEKPVHKVTLTRGFWMQETPVTQRQWESLMGANPSFFSKSGFYADKVKGLDTSNFPVENVSWNAIAGSGGFIEKLNANSSGLNFRLPTEAEWEYAARSGQNYKYSGSNKIDDVAWNYGNSGYRTHEVGTKTANGWGLFDMSGNVYEWCSDWYGKNYYADNSVVDPQGPNGGSSRVNRGGSWDSLDGRCRCAFRYYKSPEYRISERGFRLVLESAQGK